MAKELYLYSQIYDFVAENIISQMEDSGDGSDITMRMNSGGGDVFAGWGIIAKINERKGKTNMKVDGIAASMTAIILCFADYSECLDTSTIMLHRAIGDTSTTEGKTLVDNVNASLREKLNNKIDAKKLKELKGISIKNLFEDETRIDLFLTAKEAKAIGLIDKINTLSIKEAKAVTERMYAIAAAYTPELEVKSELIKNPITMTIEKLKAENPAVYAEVIALGVAQERDRVESYLVFNELDPTAVTAGIKGGKPLTQTQMAEFSLKALAKPVVAAIKKDAAGNVVTEEVITAKTEKELKIAEFDKAVNANLKVTQQF